MPAFPVHAKVFSSNVLDADANGAGDELSIQYTVDVDMPDGTILRFTNDRQQLPRRWPAGVKCKPHPTDESVLGFLVNDVLCLDYRAQPLSESCGTPTTPPTSPIVTLPNPTPQPNPDLLPSPSQTFPPFEPSPRSVPITPIPSEPGPIGPIMI